MSPSPFMAELRKKRLEKRISQDAVAAAIGVRQDTISKYECGYPGHQSPQIPTVAKWAKAIGYELVLQPKVGR